MTRPSGASQMFLVECFVAAADAVAVTDANASLRDACASLRAAGSPIECLGALVVPQDELAYHLVVASSVRTVRNAIRASGLRFDRIVASVAVGPARADALVVPVPATTVGDRDAVRPRG